MPWTRWSSTGRPGIGLPMTISPRRVRGDLREDRLRRAPRRPATLSLPTKRLDVAPGRAAACRPRPAGCRGATACENGRTNRSGVVVIVAMPSLEVCIAAWKSCTSCGPLTPFGAALLSLTPSHAGRGLRPERHLLERVLRRGRGDHRERHVLRGLLPAARRARAAGGASAARGDAQRRGGEHRRGERDGAWRTTRTRRHQHSPRDMSGTITARAPTPARAGGGAGGCRATRRPG